MKTVFVLLVLVVFAAASVEKETFAECKEETGVTVPDSVKYLTDDDDSNDEKATKFMMCYFKKTEVIDDDGHLDVEKATAVLKMYMKYAGVDIDQEILNCIQEKNTAEETVLFIGKCVEKRKAEIVESK